MLALWLFLQNDAVFNDGCLMTFPYLIFYACKTEDSSFSRKKKEREREECVEIRASTGRVDSSPEIPSQVSPPSSSSPSAAAASASRRTPAELSAPPPPPAAAVSRTPIPPVDPLSAPRPSRLGHHRTGSPAKAAMKPEPTDDSPLAACKVTPRTYICPCTPRLRSILQRWRWCWRPHPQALLRTSPGACPPYLRLGKAAGERNKPTLVWSAARRSPEQRLGTNR
jgi:hypothetical protein